jgi:hypothetical protein
MVRPVSSSIWIVYSNFKVDIYIPKGYVRNNEDGESIGHGVIVVAEGAGVNLLKDTGARDESGNLVSYFVIHMPIHSHDIDD